MLSRAEGAQSALAPLLLPRHRTSRSLTSSAPLPRCPLPTPARSFNINIDDSVTHRAWDWTFSSDYCGTLSVSCSAPQALTNHSLGERMSAAGATVFDAALRLPSSTTALTAAGASGIDYAMLRQRDVPILFFDEIQLYSDDLEDCGEVCFDAKLRVMPACWFLLSRMFLRIDGVLVRLRETRYFHRFGERDVHVEISWKECAISSGRHGAADLPYPLPHCDIAPSDLRDSNKLSQQVPVVQQKFFTSRLPEPQPGQR